jgi:hypothetical protein
MKKIVYTLLCLLPLLFTACEEEINNWPVDPSHDRPFRPAKFEIYYGAPTTVGLSYKGVIGATKYVFEFSKGDSLLFNNIVRADEIPADTLTPYDKQASIAATTYRTLFSDLAGTTRYSVRVKGVNETDGTESGYIGLCFDTPAEQIFQPAKAGVSSITLNWQSDKQVTHLRYGERTATDTLWADNATISAAEAQAGRKVLNNLKGGTRDVIQIYNNEDIRGTISALTWGTATGTNYFVQPGDDIPTVLQEQVAAGVTDLALIFSGGQSYEIGNITLPAELQTICFAGNVGADQPQPELLFHRLNLSTAGQIINMQDIDLNANMNSSNFFFDLGSANCFSAFQVYSSTIRNIGRTLVRLNHDDIRVSNILLTDCIIDNVGSSGYGLFNFGKSGMQVENLQILNCTLLEIGDQMMDIRCQIGNFRMDKCTFCNYTTGLPKVFRIEKIPTEEAVTNCIFTGTNNGAKLNSGNGDYSAWLDFSSCYITSDLVENTRLFTNIIHLDLTSEDLFVDPHNGIFYLKPGTNFRGAGIAGDPRWWQ